jgi:hypothetical protein
MKMLLWLVCLVFGTQADGLLTSFRPSAVHSDFGTVSEIEFSTGLLELEAGALAHHLPHAMSKFRFAEPVWVIGYRAEILNVRAKPLAKTTCAIHFWRARGSRSARTTR